MSRPEPFRAERQPNGLYAVVDAGGYPERDYTDICCLGEAQDHARDLNALALEEAAAQADYEAHEAPVLARAA